MYIFLATLFTDMYDSWISVTMYEFSWLPILQEKFCNPNFQSFWLQNIICMKYAILGKGYAPYSLSTVHSKVNIILWSI